MSTLEELNRKFDDSLNDGVTPNIITDGTNLEKEIGRIPPGASIFDVIRYINDNFPRLAISDRIITDYYFYVHESSRGVERFIHEAGKIYNVEYEKVPEIIYNAVTRITNEKQFFFHEAGNFKRMSNEIFNETSFFYDIIEMTEVRQYDMKNKSNPEVNMSFESMIDIFNMIEPSSEVQMIIMTQFDEKIIYKVNSEYQIFDTSTILKATYSPNTITLISQYSDRTDLSTRRTVLDFETSICKIEIDKNRKRDNTEFYIKDVIKDYIELVPSKITSVVSGAINYKISPQITYDEFYEFMVIDPLASSLFIVNETSRPWCILKDGFEILHFPPILTFMKYFVNGPFPLMKLKIPSVNKTQGIFSVRFTTESEDMVEPTAKILNWIISKYRNVRNDIKVTNYKLAFSTTVLFELKQRVHFLFESISESSGKAYATKCPNKPVNLHESEVKDYMDSGFDTRALEFNGKKYWFTCIMPDNPYVKFFEAKIPIKSGNTQFFCCGSKPDSVSTSRKIEDIRSSNTVGTSSAIKSFSGISILEPGIFNEFIKESFSSELEFKPHIRGTSFHKSDEHFSTINDSAIGALILATQDTGEYDELFTTSHVDVVTKFKNIVNDVRRRMIELPYEIYAQELYDVSREEFVKNICDPNHNINPYYYYRGLEEIFDVDIFVFTSGKWNPRKKKNVLLKPSSFEEMDLNYPSLEIPRCKNYHVRRNMGRRMVILYKNYGTNRTSTMGDVSACELLTMVGPNKENISVFDPANQKFFEAIWGYYMKCNFVLHFEINDDEVEAYEKIQIEWNPNHFGFGPVLGQELNISGKTSLLIFRDWNVVVPGTQPLNLAEGTTKAYARNRQGTKVTHGDVDFYMLPSGTTQRAELKTKQECLDFFDVTHEEEDGVWIEFQGNSKGLFILCKPNKEITHVEYETVNDVIDTKNTISALLQLINWLWRSDYTEENGYPSFRDWFDMHVRLIDSSIFLKPGQPRKFLNNLYLPPYTNYRDRINFCTYYWPFFFRHHKIYLYQKLFERICRMMEVQEKYTNYLIPDNLYQKVPRFITNLVPTQTSYRMGGSLIFTSREQMEKWISYTNSSVYNNSSLNNSMIIHSKIYKELESSRRPFLFRECDTETGDINKIYLVQNIMDKSNGARHESLALQVAYEWEVRRVNIGAFHKNREITVDVQDLRYVKMALQDEIPVPVIDKTDGTTDYLIILRYSSDRYAAMLPIL